MAQFPNLWGTVPSPTGVPAMRSLSFSTSPSVTVQSSSQSSPGAMSIITGSYGGGSGSGLTDMIKKLSQGMAQEAGGAAAENPERPLRPTAETPSGRNYKDPRLSSPSWMGGSNRFDDSTHGANVVSQLAARPAPPTSGGGGGSGSGGTGGGGSSGGGHGHRGGYGGGWRGRGLLGGLRGLRRWW